MVETAKLQKSKRSLFLSLSLLVPLLLHSPSPVERGATSRGERERESEEEEEVKKHSVAHCSTGPFYLAPPPRPGSSSSSKCSLSSEFALFPRHP